MSRTNRNGFGFPSAHDFQASEARQEVSSPITRMALFRMPWDRRPVAALVPERARRSAHPGGCRSTLHTENLRRIAGLCLTPSSARVSGRFSVTQVNEQRCQPFVRQLRRCPADGDFQVVRTCANRGGTAHCPERAGEYSSRTAHVSASCCRPQAFRRPKRRVKGASSRTSRVRGLQRRSCEPRCGPANPRSTVWLLRHEMGALRRAHELTARGGTRDARNDLVAKRDSHHSRQHAAASGG